MFRYSKFREHKERMIPRWVLAQSLGVSKETVKSWLYRKKLKGRYLSDVLDFLEENPKYLRRIKR